MDYLELILIGIKPYGGVVKAGKIDSLTGISELSLPELYAPYITGSLVKKQPTEINEQVRFINPSNEWQDYYVILSGGVINNEDVQVIQITSSTIAKIKNIIETKYSHIDNTNTYKITGNIEQIPTPITCGYMSGITGTETITTSLVIDCLTMPNNYSGTISSLQIPEYCYNKNIQYFDLIKLKNVKLNRDEYYDLYSRNCFDRYTKDSKYNELSALAA